MQVGQLERLGARRRVGDDLLQRGGGRRTRPAGRCGDLVLAFHKPGQGRDLATELGGAVPFEEGDQRKRDPETQR